VSTTTHFSEHAVFFDAEGEQLFGVVTLPTVVDRGVGVVLLPGGRYSTSAGRNRLQCRMARRLAHQGFSVVRFDYHGIGDSAGVVPEFVLGEPFVDDFAAAAGVLRGYGIESVIAVGDCFGARTALAGAVQGTPTLVGQVLALLPWRDSGRTELAQDRMVSEMSVRDYADHFAFRKVVRAMSDPKTRDLYRRLLAKKTRQLAAGARNRVRGVELDSWASTTVLRQLRSAARRNLPTLLVYGLPEGDEHSEDFAALEPKLTASVLQEPAIEFVKMPAILGGFRVASAQDDFIDVVEEWLVALVPLAEAEPELPVRFA
jgi:pimeloyl-ACP methyl ester carboxylesterase